MESTVRWIQQERGVFLRRELLDLGYDDKAIRRAVRSGAWHRVRQGAYVFADAWHTLTPEEQYGVRGRAALRQARTEVALSHTSALQEAGDTFWDLDLTDVHLSRTDGRSGRREAGVRQHRGLLLPGDLDQVNRLRLTSATRTALDISTVADTERALVVVNALLHDGRTTPEALQARYALMERWPHTLGTDLVLRLADGRIESVLESRTFFALWRGGVPKPEPQFEIQHPSGRPLAAVDFAWPERKAFLECDGKAKYLRLRRRDETIDEVILREKRRQDRICELTGWICIRVTWADLYHPELLVARVRRTLGLDRVAW